MQISNEVIKILEYLGEKIGITIDWTSSNVIPIIKDLCEKYIRWEISTSIAWIIIVSVILLIFIIINIILSIKECDEDITSVLWVCIFVGLIISIPIIVSEVFDIVECKTFPEKAIYEYIAEELDD